MKKQVSIDELNKSRKLQMKKKQKKKEKLN